jgi:hypothetical protein
MQLPIATSWNGPPKEILAFNFRRENILAAVWCQSTVGAVYRGCEEIGIRRYSPPCITARRGGCVIKEILRSHRSRRSRGGFPFVPKRRLRDILLIARPPLLAVMQGGDCATPKHLHIFFTAPIDRPYRKHANALKRRLPVCIPRSQHEYSACGDGIGERALSDAV